MSGTRAGGLKAKVTNLQRDPDFYKKIGKIGGQNGHTGGFASNRALASVAGAKGGRISKRGCKRPTGLSESEWEEYKAKYKSEQIIDALHKLERMIGAE